MDGKILYQFIIDFIGILNEMAPYLLLGFLFAGILKVFVPQRFIDGYLGNPNTKSVVYASLLGVPLPLCSCGVIPTGVSIHKNGASKGATVSFLISTPQTGIDSILATFALLGLPFAILRPVVALVTGIFGGVLTNRFGESNSRMNNKIVNDTSCLTDSCGCESDCGCETDTHCGCESEATGKKYSKLYMMLKYAFVDFLQDISKWLIIGLLLAAALSALVPDNFFEQFVGNQWLEMLVVLVIALPLYVCATGSIPIAAVLMMKGLSPGAALVFLMAGPATNLATITVLRNTLGKRSMWTYLISIIVGAIVFGAVINSLLPTEWFSLHEHVHAHDHSMLPEWLKWGSSIALVLLMLNGYYQRKKSIQIKSSNDTMNKKTIIVNGMTCNHCKNSVEKHIGALKGIASAQVNLDTKELFVQGDAIDLAAIKKEIESLGYEYVGEKTEK